MIFGRCESGVSFNFVFFLTVLPLCIRDGFTRFNFKTHQTTFEKASFRLLQFKKKRKKNRNSSTYSFFMLLILKFQSATSARRSKYRTKKMAEAHSPLAKPFIDTGKFEGRAFKNFSQFNVQTLQHVASKRFIFLV